MASSDRDILERAVQAIAEQAAKANDVIDEAINAGLDADHPATVAAKMLRLELLKTKADLERGLSEFVLNCKRGAWSCTGFRGSACRTLATGGTSSSAARRAGRLAYVA